MKSITLWAMSILGVLLLFSGCAGRAIPNNIGGKYYMAGDDKCKKARRIADSRIMCINSDGKETGYRDAMTDQELQMYMHRDAQEEASSRSINNQLNYNNQQNMNRNLWQR